MRASYRVPGYPGTAAAAPWRPSEVSDAVLMRPPEVVSYISAYLCTLKYWSSLTEVSLHICTRAVVVSLSRLQPAYHDCSGVQ